MPAHISSNSTLKLETDKEEQAGGPAVGPQLSCLFVSVSPSVVMSHQGGELRSHTLVASLLLHGGMPPSLVRDTGLARILYFMSDILKVELFF